MKQFRIKLEAAAEHSVDAIGNTAAHAALAGLGHARAHGLDTALARITVRTMEDETVLIVSTETLLSMPLLPIILGDEPITGVYEREIRTEKNEWCIFVPYTVGQVAITEFNRRTGITKDWSGLFTSPFGSGYCTGGVEHMLYFFKKPL